MNWYDAQVWGLTAASVGQVAFVAVYSRRDWRAHFIGKALFIQSVALLAALTLTVVYRLFPALPLEGPVRTYAFWALAAAVWGQFASLVAQSQLDHRKPHPYRDPIKPESWYWIEYRPSGHYAAIRPPLNHHWLVLRNDEEVAWFSTPDGAAFAVKRMVDADTIDLLTGGWE